MLLTKLGRTVSKSFKVSCAGLDFSSIRYSITERIHSLQAFLLEQYLQDVNQGLYHKKRNRWRIKILSRCSQR